MFTLRQSPRFRRKLKKLIRTNRTFIQPVNSVLLLLAESPGHPRLKSHKVLDSDGRPAFSVSVTDDIRIIWEYAEDAATIDLLDIGGHSGAGKVYR
jgi:mRNA-degrading endonuclease YafQ of YafQ-DinJ toxin-antitoxin module